MDDDKTESCQSQQNDENKAEKESCQDRQVDTQKQHKNNGVIPRWKPGESGNPNGRPKRPESLRAALRRKLRQNPSMGVLTALQALGVSEKDAPTAAGGIAEVLLIQAAKGDVQAARLIATHCERPLKTDQPEAQPQINVTFMEPSRAREIIRLRGGVILPEDRERLLLGGGEPGESLALPVAPVALPPVDPLEELATFAV